MRRSAAGLAVAVLLTCLGLRVASAAPGEATAAVKQAHEKLKTLLAREAPLTDELRALIDVRELTQKALATHWGKLTEPQRTRFVGLLETIIHRSHTKALRTYLEFPVVYGGETAEAGSVRVKTIVKAVERGRTVDLHVVYLMARTPAGWRVWDLVTDGVSVLKNYRSQFNRIITKEGIDGLLAKLQKKVDQGT